MRPSRRLARADSRQAGRENPHAGRYGDADGSRAPPRAATAPRRPHPGRVAGPRLGAPWCEPRRDRPSARNERERGQVPPRKHRRQARRGRDAAAATVDRVPRVEPAGHQRGALHGRNHPHARACRPGLALRARHATRGGVLRPDARAAAHLHVRRPRLLRLRRAAPLPPCQARRSLGAGIDPLLPRGRHRVGARGAATPRRPLHRGTAPHLHG